MPTADFFDFESLLSVQEQRKLNELRRFLATEIAPYAGQWWEKAEFP
ncbi:acyl-CoA dehydrogenase, partial [Arthrobacter sp. PO-11]|nr:acyl-CoA dehydrogenase [Arthrobacter cavernae]